MLKDFGLQLSPGSASAQRKAAATAASSSATTAAASPATAAAASPATATPSCTTAFAATTLLSARQGSTLHQSVKEVLALLHCFLFL
jgi:hypothetical protein